MRGRRNTHVSTLSTSSSSSSDSATSTPARNSLSEKDTEKQIHDDQIPEEHSKSRRAKCSPNLLMFYRIASFICIICFICVSLVRHRHVSLDSQAASISPNMLPDNGTKAGVVTFTDRAGKLRWTVSVPQNNTFPLPSTDYERICHEASRYRTTDQLTMWERLWHHTSEIVHDPAFMDISEAQALSILPADTTQHNTRVCDSSLTFIIDSTEASFGKTLLLLWLSYGLAKSQGKAFFLDDSRWLYGKYDSYFPPLPRPACSRPATSNIVPCPLQAKHVVITPATAEIAFHQHSKRGMMYDLMRAGYKATFSLIGDDAQYAMERVGHLRRLADEHNQPLIGMHIRRGDLRPFELEYSQDYLPLERFTDAAKSMLTSKSTTALIMASDDPDIIDSPELVLAASPHHLHKSQERIQLATKLALDRSSPALPIREPGSAYVKHVDENAGWDGGFYTALFHSTGGHNAQQGRQRVLTSEPSADTLQLRELIGRGYLLDLEVLSEADGVICAVSSAACRLLAVMMGRDAVKAGKWVNVDDRRPWSWDGQQR